MLRRIVFSFVVLFWSGASISSTFPGTVDVKGTSLKVEEMISGRGVIWSFGFLPSGDILFAERSGKIFRFDPKSKDLKEVSGVPKVAERGQGGLLDLKFHPEFSSNNLVYLTYAVSGEGGYTTRLARATYTSDSLQNIQVLFTAQPFSKSGQHFGSRIAFQDGHVFLTVGDRGQRDGAQDLGRHNGKVIRLRDNGEVPEDNPFVGRRGALPEIWSYGHRNPQGLYVHPETGKLWLHEHGPRGGDEINLVEKGLNYGWPKATFGREYFGPKIGQHPPLDGTEPPRKHYTPSIAPCGFTIVPKGQLGSLSGAFVLGALVLTHLNLVWPEGEGFSEEVRLFESAKQRVRSVGFHSGALYFSTDSGSLVRLSPLDKE